MNRRRHIALRIVAPAAAFYKQPSRATGRQKSHYGVSPLTKLCAVFRLSADVSAFIEEIRRIQMHVRDRIFEVFGSW